MKLRNECKHVITECEIAQLRQRLKVVARYDPYSASNGDYQIRSLYFDNCYDTILKEKIMGIGYREKFRIRFYNNNTEFIRLEKKSKINGLCMKQGTALNPEQVQSIINGDNLWMKNSDDELIKELYAKMQYQLLRPKNIVVYDREAFVYKPGNVRVTIDSNIRGSYNIYKFLTADEVDTKLFSKAILEVKWDEFLPQVIRDIVQLPNIKTSSFSKYAATRFSAF